MKKRISNNKISIFVLMLLFIIFILYFIYNKPLTFSQLTGHEFNKNEIKCDITILKIDLSSGKIVTSSKTTKLNSSQTNELIRILNKYTYRKVFTLSLNSKVYKIPDEYQITIFYYSEKKSYNHLVINETGIISDSDDNQLYRIDQDKIRELFDNLRLYIQ
jgi:zona occludens toxin (predicted ATPase)